MSSPFSRDPAPDSPCDAEGRFNQGSIDLYLAPYHVDHSKQMKIPRRALVVEVREVRYQVLHHLSRLKESL